MRPAGGFDAAHRTRHRHVWLVDTRGRCTRLPVSRWHGPPEAAVQALIDRCAGPTVDVGCGPGRLTAELAGRGIVSLGVDTSAAAVRMTRERGAAALRRNVFDPLPGDGRWSHVLLVDGNIGIGGDPGALLRRCAGLLRRGGTVLVELERGGGLWRGRAYLTRHQPAQRRPAFAATVGRAAFCWASLGVDAVRHVAAESGLAVRAVFERDLRWFAELERP